MSRKNALVLSAMGFVLAVACIAGCSPQNSSNSAGSSSSGSASSASTTSASTTSASTASASTTTASSNSSSPVNALSSLSGFPASGRFVDSISSLPGFYQHSEKDAANAAANAPRQYTDRNGFLVQPVPSDPIGYNETYLNADNRGCTSCHTLEDAIMSLPTYHRLIFFGYATEQGYENCIACHSSGYAGISLAETIHTLHFDNAAFKSMNGDCESCHAFGADGSVERWDQVKYDLYQGITKVDSDTAGLKVSYDQTTITPKENRFWKSIKDEPKDWVLDDTSTDQSVYDNWTISIDGDCENPVDMTLPEMVEKFGTVKQVMKQDCTINGVGQATIEQCEVEGIPLSKVIEYAKPKASANVISPISTDGYDYAQMSIQWLEDNDAIIVTKIDGETLPNSQGYPCQLWVNKTSGGDFVKRISNLTFMTVDPSRVDSELYVGQYLDDATGEIYSKPNSAVLNYPTGIVFQNQVGKAVHLEGFADAWDEPIAKIEFSMDRGKTWTTLDTPNNNADYWTYWKLDYTPPSAGAYLLEIRTTSTESDGTARVCQYDTKFMFNVES